MLLSFFRNRFGEDRLDHSAYRIDTFVPPGFRIDVQRDAAQASCVAHVVTGDLEAGAEAPHEAGVDGPEAPEVYRLLDTRFFRHGLYMPVEEVMPIKCLPRPIGKDEVVWFMEILVAGPHPLYAGNLVSICIHPRLGPTRERRNMVGDE